MASRPLLSDEELDRGAAMARQGLSAQINRNIVTGGNPSQARSDAALARATGLPARAMDASTRPIAEVRRQQTWAEEALARAPSLLPIFGDPSRFERISDDINPLASVARAAAGQVRGAPNSFARRVREGSYLSAIALSVRDTLAAAGSAAGEGLAGLARGTIENLPNMVPGLAMPMQSGVAVAGFDPVQAGANVARDVGQYFGDARRANQVDYGHWVPNAAARGIESVPLMVAALASAARGNPGGAVSILAGISGGSAYSEAREAGLPVAEATRFGVTQGGLEALGESLPVFGFAADIARGSGLFRTIGGQVWRENLGEQFTQHLQDFNRWSSVEANQGRPFSEFLAERPQIILETAIATTAATGLQTAAARGITSAADRFEQAQGARAEARRLDRIMEAAAGSVTRRESPEDFREIITELANDNVYVPPAAIRALFQDAPDDLSDDSFWNRYADQISEAEAIGGDVVIPIAEAATHLAGTPQWQAIRDQVRTSPGGFSRSETDEANAEFETAIRESGEQLEQELSAERQRLEPVQRVFEAMRDKLMQAGFRTDAAAQLATQFAQRQATRAQRLGRELTGTEADPITVRYTLPDRLNTVIRQATVPDAGLRAVITEMRRPRAVNPRSIYGPSLLEWVRSRGGLTDRGGDLAAMGFAPMGRGFAARGAKKLIRPTEEAGMFGGEGNENSPDTMFRAAIVAGYFPNLTEESGADEADIATFYEALDNEFRGRPTYSLQNDKSDRPENQVRMAAQELADILQQAGLSPTNASEAEITRALEQYQQGQSFDQSLFDDPAQPRRTMTQAQRAELEARQQQGMARRGGGLFSSERDQESLFQSYSEGVRGRITFNNDGSMIVDLFKERDLSTFIHESGHLYLEEIKADAQIALEMDTQDARQLFADWETIKAWFAREGYPVGEDGTIPTEAHELFARGFERYAMEGKAPSAALRGPFEAFRSWLVSIYKMVSRLRAPITAEIRDVMSRLLATDEEIAAAAESENIKALFETAEQAAEFGMTPQAYAAYRGSAEEAREDANDSLLRRVMATVRAARTKEWKDREAGVRAEVAEGIDTQPVFKALRLLRTGQLGDEEARRVKLDRDWLIETYGPDAPARMPKSVPPIYADTNTMPADEITELTGFASGDELARTLMGHEDTRRELRASGEKRSPRQVLIDEGVAARMAEEYGDPLRDGSIEEEAREIIRNDKQGDRLAAELRALATRTNKRPTPYALARQWAAEKVATSRVVDVTSGQALQQYMRAARKASKAATDALIARDYDEAFKQKQSEMLNNALVAEGRKAKEAVEKAVSRMGKIARRRTMVSVDQDYLDQAHDLLETVEFQTRSQRALDRQASFEEWSAAQIAKGHDIVVPPSFAASLGRDHWSRLTVESLTGLDAAVQQIMHLGRLKQTLRDGLEQRAFDEVVAEAVDGAGGLRQIPPSDNLTPSFGESMKAKVANFDAALLKIETLVDWLDSGNANGVFNRVVFKPIADAQAKAGDMLADYTRRLNDALAAVPAKTLRRWNDRVTLPELLNRETGNPFTLTRQQLISMALNMGNEGNAQRLSDGYGWNEEQILAVLNRELSPDEWAYVQQVWDIIDGLWPQIETLERNINGIARDKIEARPIETPHGTFRGGYFPAVYDSSRDYDAEKNAARETDLFETLYTRASTRASSTKERADKVSRPILLNLGVINRHVGEVIHDVTHREAVMNADKFLSSRRVMKAMDSAIGQQSRQQFRPWLKFVANQWAAERAGNEGIAAFIGKLRSNTTIVGMGWRASTVMMQIVGYSNSFEVVGARWVGPAVAQVAASPAESFRFVMERSDEIRHRMDTLDRDIGQALSRLTSAAPNPLTAAKRFAFHGIGYMDRIVVIPTWIGAYNKSLAAGMTEQEAAYAADKAVRQSQGAAGAKDMAAVARGGGRWGEALRLMTMFYSYVSAVYQRQRTLGRDVRNAKASDIPNIAARAWWLIVVPPILAELIAGRGPDEEEDWGWWAFRNMLFQALGAVPVVRDVARPAWDRLVGNPGFGYRLTPLQGAGEAVVNVAGDAGRVARGDETTRGTRNALELVGYSTGLVPGQIAQATQFLVNVGYGDEQPEGVGDWYEGLTTGRIKDD